MMFLTVRFRSSELGKHMSLTFFHLVSFSNSPFRLVLRGIHFPKAYTTSQLGFATHIHPSRNTQNQIYGTRPSVVFVISNRESEKNKKSDGRLTEMEELFLFNTSSCPISKSLILNNHIQHHASRGPDR